MQELKFSPRSLIPIYTYSSPTLLPCRCLVLWPDHDPASLGELSRGRARGCEPCAVLPELPHGPHPSCPCHTGPADSAVWPVSLHLRTVCSHRAHAVFLLCEKVSDYKWLFSKVSKGGHLNLIGSHLWLLRAPVTPAPSCMECPQPLPHIATGSLVLLFHLTVTVLNASLQ